MTGSSEVPKLAGDALRAVKHRGSHLQIIASAGSGKTEVVAQRVADLFADGVAPDSVVAFTFTERAAESLRTRIEQRVSSRLGEAFLHRMNGCFIGTIHAYCFRLLQTHVPTFETYDVLDEHCLAALLTREANYIGIRDLSPNGRLFEGLQTFLANNEVVDNELLTLESLDEPFKGMVERLWSRLESYRFLTYGRQVALAVDELKNQAVFDAVHRRLSHLIVDEYQDINPAQEALIRRLTTGPVELCVVGDDDQSIYQWRGSDVGNIVSFANRYPDVRAFNITTNRRSRPSIIAAANDFSETIEGRLEKAMLPSRDAASVEFVAWQAATEADEASVIADTINQLKRTGFQFRDIAILVRSSTSYAKLLDALDSHGIPVKPGDRTGLFGEPDAQRFGRIVAYLADSSWRATPYEWGATVTLSGLISALASGYGLAPSVAVRVRRQLEAWHAEVISATRPANLVKDFYALLGLLGVAEWDLTDPVLASRLGTLARCSAVLADYESVRRRPRSDPQTPGAMISARDRGEQYYQWLAVHVQNWALGAYRGFEGEEDLTLDAVDITTVHKAKGLEWSVVFVPSLSSNRFPSFYTGKPGNWVIPANLFNRSRYEGTVNDERRTFYVAITRARDWLSVSTHLTPNSKPVSPSPFLLRMAEGFPRRLEELPLPNPPVRPAPDEEPVLSITFSELAEYASCGFAYRLRSQLGFQPPLAPELGYGKAVHHVMREVAEFTRRYGGPPSAGQVSGILDESFFLPAASRATHAALKESARRLVNRYITDHADDLRRVWEVERPFELHLGGALVSGRADVILDEENGVISSLAIVDYKTSVDPIYDYDLQLQVYTDAGRREGLTVEAAYVHDLKEGIRSPVSVDAGAITEAEDVVNNLVERLKVRDFTPSPSTERCKRCDVRALCKSAV